MNNKVKIVAITVVVLVTDSIIAVSLGPLPVKRNANLPTFLQLAV
jgi:hypothetical protein